MALAMTLTLLPAVRALEPTAVSPAAPPATTATPTAADLTPQELIQAAERAAVTADWPAVEAHCASLVTTWQATPELAEPVRRARPLWATARLQLKKYDPETLDLLDEVLADSRLDPATTDEMAFWRALCHLQTGSFAKAYDALTDYDTGRHLGPNLLPSPSLPLRGTRRAESLLLRGLCLLQDGRPGDAAAFLAPHLGPLREDQRPEIAGRAAVMCLHGLVTAGENDTALTLVRSLQPHLGEVTQMVALQSLMLQLGSRLLENNRPHDAIVCLQRVWSRDRILAHQQAALERVTRRLASLRQAPGHTPLAHQLEHLRQQLEKETERFRQSESFDAALRLRLAAAYRDLGRAREAALILEDMLERLPADAVVEKAALSLIQCWMQVERWPRAVAAADAYLGKFNRHDNPDIPMVRFLKATSLHADRRPHDAELAFATVHQLHPDHDLAPKALFLEGICLLEQELHREALDAFAETGQRYPQADAVEDAAYWSAMALSFEKRHAEARERLHAYLTEYRDRARHAVEARFRIAFSTFGLAEYTDAVTEFEAFLASHADHPLAAEAYLLLGDALGALGRLDDAMAAYRRVDRTTSERFHEEAVFRIGNVLKVSEQPDALRAHFGKFMAEHPGSRRLAEAVHWIGHSHQRAGHPETARDTYWQVVTAHGNNPEAAGIEDVLTTLATLYPLNAPDDELVTRLNDLATTAGSRQPTLALRALWAKARRLSRTNPERARSELAALLPQIEPRHHHPRLTADCADALRESGRRTEARTLYLELRKWHPRAIEKDRAFLGLGLLALDEGKPAEALDFLARFEQETIGSPLLGEVAALKAKLFEDQGRDDEARAEYDRLLELPAAPRPLKARALLRLGDLMARRQQDLKSTAYYERVYVSYGSCRAESATAYARRAAALERLGRPEAATEVWRELATRDELAEFPEAAEARTRLRALDTAADPAAAGPPPDPPS